MTQRPLLLAFAAAAAFATPLLASSTILGIPGECRMETHVVQVGADGKATRPPTQLTSVDVFGTSGWPRAFHLSHDGKRLIAHNFSGVQLLTDGGKPQDYKVQIQWRNAFFGPDNHRFFYWTPEGIALADFDAPGAAEGPLKATPVLEFKKRPGKRAANAGWSPSGTHLIVLEHFQEQPAKPGGKPTVGSALLRVGTSGDVSELWRRSTQCYYFMLPLSAFEDGSGPHSDPFKIAVGANDGLYVINSDGSGEEKVSDFKHVGLQDIVMSPDSKKILFRLGATQVSADGKTKYDGVFLGHLDRWSKGKQLELEPLYSQNNAHTIWFSPGGKLALWASESTLQYRAPDAKADTTVTLDPPERKGLPIRGATFDKTGSRIAFTAGPRLFVHDVAKKATTLVHDANDPKAFVADPVWKNASEIVFTKFVDTKTGVKKPQPK